MLKNFYVVYAAININLIFPQRYTIHILFDDFIFACVTKSDCEQTEIDLEYSAQQFLQLLRKTYKEQLPLIDKNKSYAEDQIWIRTFLVSNRIIL